MAAPPHRCYSNRIIRCQHDRLNSLLEAIENRFRHDHGPSRNLMSLLLALVVHLQTLFEIEESDGYFEELVQKAPRMAAQVDYLLHEHSEMLQEVDELVNIASKVLATNHDIADLAARYAQFRSKVVTHEHLENKLLQDAYNVDVGTKD
jgi:hypothetical protein